MPFKDKEKLKEWKRNYMQAYRKGERRTRKIRRTLRRTIREKNVEPNVEPCVEPSLVTQKTVTERPKVIESTPSPFSPPALTKTHRFEIRAKPTHKVQVKGIEHAVVKSKGRDGRIEYAEIFLPNSVIELYANCAKIYPTDELVGLGEERIAGMKNVLKRACEARGIILEQESKWAVGEYSHTTMEDKGLNDALTPLALVHTGDEDWNMFKDDGSHPGKVESAGKENWAGTNLLYKVLFELPIENAKQISVFSEQIKLHMEVLRETRDVQKEQAKVAKEMNKTLIKIQETLEQLGGKENEKK